MSVKIEVNENMVFQKDPWENENIMFPCLGKNKKNGDVVLFKSYGIGTIIASEDQDKIGNCSRTLVMNRYLPLPNGASVTLTQKLP